jgi:hypothetical protein
MTKNSDTQTFLSPEAMENFKAALDRPAAPTPEAIATAKRYRDKIADGTLIVSDDTSDFADWAKDGFEKLMDQ